MENAIEPLLTAKEVAELLGRHEQTVYTMARNGELASVKMGSRSLRFRPSAIQAYLQSKEQEAAAPVAA